MPTEQQFLDIKIMGREYRVACNPEEQAALHAAVDLVDGKMRDIAQKTKNTIAERVAVMAALNLAHEYLAFKNNPANEGVDTQNAKRRIKNMGARLNTVLAPQEQLTLLTNEQAEPSGH